MNLLLVTSRYPWPPRRGDQLRTVQMIDLLAAEHQLVVLAPERPAGAPPPPEGLSCRLVGYRDGGRVAAARGLAFAATRGLPLQSGLFHQPELRRRLRELAPAADLGILQLVRLAAHADDFGATPLVVDLIDSLSLNLSRRALVDRRWLRPLLRLEARLLATWERRLLQRAVGGWVVCERDRQALLHPPPRALELAERLAVVPLAVPLRPPPARPLAGARPMLALTGNLGYFVNHDAARWFLEQVWPPLRAQAPELRLVLAGDRPAASLRHRIAAVGAELVESPPELPALLAAATVSLAPMRCGSGQPLKILEAWATGVPVVASPWAAAGAAATDGEDLLVAERPGDWVRAILGLVADRAARERLAEGGRARLRAAYAPEVVRRRLLALLAAQRPQGGRPAPAAAVAG